MDESRGEARAIATWTAQQREGGASTEAHPEPKTAISGLLMKMMMMTMMMMMMKMMKPV